MECWPFASHDALFHAPLIGIAAAEGFRNKAWTSDWPPALAPTDALPVPRGLYGSESRLPEPEDASVPALLTEGTGPILSCCPVKASTKGGPSRRSRPLD
jgi:hypothetical protein